MRSIHFLLCLVLVVSCSPADPAAGTERGPCLPSGGCDVGLVCRSNLCVRDVVPDAGSDAPELLDALEVVDAPTDAPTPDGGPMRTVAGTYVVARFVFPATSAQSDEFGADLDGDGVVDNTFGMTISALAGATGGGFADAVDDYVEAGTHIDLVARATTPSPTVGAVVWAVGTSPVPTPCEAGTCGRHLTGTGMFSLAGTPVWRTTSIASGVHTSTASAPAIQIPVSLFGEPPTLVSVRRPRIIVDGTDARIHGAVRASDIDAELRPGLVVSMGAVVTRDCPGEVCVAESLGETLLDFFDADGEFGISLRDLTDSSVIDNLLAADLDIEDAAGNPGTDGTAESISIGVALELAAATFPLAP